MMKIRKEQNITNMKDYNMNYGLYSSDIISQLNSSNKLHSKESVKNQKGDTEEFEFTKQEYEPSEEEEDYFFKDFCSTYEAPNQLKSQNNEFYPAPRPRKFNLAAFVQDLHNSRYSVVQNHSDITIPEESGLEKLLNTPVEQEWESDQQPTVSIPQKDTDTDSNKIAIDEDSSFLIEDDEPFSVKENISTITTPSKPKTNLVQPLARKDSLVKRSISTLQVSPTSYAKTKTLLDQEKRQKVNLNLEQTQEKRDKENTEVDQFNTSPTRPSFFRGIRPINRSKSQNSVSHSPIRQLIRNNSTNTCQYKNQGMSRAAMAVIQHQSNPEPAQTEANGQKPIEILSHFISRASSIKRDTKRVNMNQENCQRNQVVRRTIIYVQPDSLHSLLKEGGHGVNIPPQPYATPHAINITKEEGLATRLSTSSDSTTESELSEPNYLEGLEFREMDDGSMVWGIVKKQGNRSSFYIRNQNNDNFECIEQNHDSPPPPIPKRSPRRQPSCRKNQTQVYYSNDVTLPHLINFMKDPPIQPYTYEKNQHYIQRTAMKSIDDQLDEMIRLVSNQ